MSLTLYKYREWNNNLHKTLLTKNQLFLSSPTEFDDPEDAKIPILYHNATNEQILKMVSEIVDHVHFRWNDDAKREQAEHLTKMIIASGKLKDFAHVQNFNEWRKGYMDEKFRICSLTERRDTDRLWIEYAEKYKGFCVGFNRAKLDFYIKNDFFQQNLNPAVFVKNPVVILEPVSYVRIVRLFLQ